MGIDKIIAKIKSDANAEVQRIEVEAKQEVDKILAEADKKGKQEYANIVERGKRDIEAIGNRIKSGARMGARRITMEARGQGISQCFTEAVKSLNCDKTKKYETVLKRLVVDGIEVIGLDEVIIMSAERDHAIVKKVVSSMSDKVVMGKESIDAIGGVIIKSSSGDVTVNNTFEAILERQKNDLRYGVSKILYEVT
ncbi:MAG: V-type ATP synthase subunit E [Methanosarcinales archaeon Met12]|nr:MAG: V-type ATP synthase subunit E [Methanosarcinales archaeon Met12]